MSESGVVDEDFQSNNPPVGVESNRPHRVPLSPFAVMMKTP
jgi:hypothetical protein